MPASVDARLEALELLVISHVIAADKRAPGSAHATLEQGGEMAEQLADAGDAASARQLRDLLNTIRVVVGPRHAV